MIEKELTGFVKPVSSFCIYKLAIPSIVLIAWGFDKLAARAVIDAKKAHPEVTLTLLLPYHPAERPIEVPQGFDGTYYPPDMERVPRRVAIIRANRYMVDHVDYLIAYAWHPASNARELVEYAKTNVKILRVTEISRKRDVYI